MHKTRLRKLAVLLPCIAALTVILAVPAFAISEADVEATVASQGKESVSGNLFVWFLCAIAFLKVSTKIDSILQAMGLGVGRAPGSILAEAFMALRGMQAGKAVLAGKMPGRCRARLCRRDRRGLRLFGRFGRDGQFQIADRYRRRYGRRQRRCSFRHRGFPV